MFINKSFIEAYRTSIGTVIKRGKILLNVNIRQMKYILKILFIIKYYIIKNFKIYKSTV